MKCIYDDKLIMPKLISLLICFKIDQFPLEVKLTIYCSPKCKQVSTIFNLKLRMMKPSNLVLTFIHEAISRILGLRQPNLNTLPFQTAKFLRPAK